MKKELQSGIVEFDLLVEQFENGEINFVELTSALWNKGYKEGNKEGNKKAYSQALVSGSVCKKCGVNFTPRLFKELTICDRCHDAFLAK